MTAIRPADGASSSAAGGDRDAFEEFYRTTVQRTFDIARRAAAGDKHLAHDATQDAYVEMLQRWQERRGRCLQDNRRYVVGIAVHKVVDWYRQRGRLTELRDDHDHGQEDAGFAEVIGELSVLPLVRDLISRQPPARRAVAVLVFFENQGYDEVARILEVDTSTVRTQVHRLRQLLKPLVNAAMDSEQAGEWS
jgi:RNA polymerase sigma-70 factor, ECF subfamily